MKFKRISETEWEDSSLLPVQFASLIEPEKAEITDSIIEIRKFLLDSIFSRFFTFYVYVDFCRSFVDFCSLRKPVA